MTPSERDERSHGEGYPGVGKPDGGADEDRYGVRRDPPRPDRHRRKRPKPATPPPAHERHSGR